jgi:hypothetical protein
MPLEQAEKQLKIEVLAFLQVRVKINVVRKERFHGCLEGVD